MNQQQARATRTMEVSEPWASSIFNGMKKVEVRKNDPKNWGSLKENDQLLIKNKMSGEVRLFRIVDIRVYEGINDCIISEGVRNLLPGYQTLAGARRIYLGFDGDSAEAMAKRETEFAEHGAMAIELTPVVDPLDDLQDKMIQLNLIKANSRLNVVGMPTREVSDNKSGDIACSRYAQMGICARPLAEADMPLNPPSPGGDPNCSHCWDTGVSAVEMNDETMGGSGSGWDKRCNRCGKVWYNW